MPNACEHFKFGALSEMSHGRKHSQPRLILVSTERQTFGSTTFQRNFGWQYSRDADTINRVSFHEFIIISDKYTRTCTYLASNLRIVEIRFFCWKIVWDKVCACLSHDYDKCKCVNSSNTLGHAIAFVFVRRWVVFGGEQNVLANCICELMRE